MQAADDKCAFVLVWVAWTLRKPSLFVPGDRPSGGGEVSEGSSHLKSFQSWDALLPIGPIGCRILSTLWGLLLFSCFVEEQPLSVLQSSGNSIELVLSFVSSVRKKVNSFFCKLWSSRVPKTNTLYKVFDKRKIYICFQEPNPNPMLWPSGSKFMTCIGTAQVLFWIVEHHRH